MSGPGRIRLRKVTRASLTINITLLILGACTVAGLLFLDGRDVHLFVAARSTVTPAAAAPGSVNGADRNGDTSAGASDASKAAARETSFFSAVGATFKDLGKMFFNPRAVSDHFSLDAPLDRFLVRMGLGFLNSTFGQAVYAVLITLGLGFLTTLIGAVIALALGLLASRNLSTPRVSFLIKGFVAFIRAIPTVLWVLIFAIGAGLGSVAAIVGMSFHSVGYLIKAYSESFEEIDAGVIEALKASGANWLQIVFQAVLPSSVSYILSWTFVRFEINFTTAVAMGAAAGAGGIGYNLWMASYFLNIREMGYITYLILAIAIAMEIIATRLKKRQRIQS